MQKPPSAYRVLHISDIHFCLFPNQLRACFSKRMKALVRLFFGGAPFHAFSLLTRFPQFVKTLDIDAICITGDLSLTALESEFSQAHAFVQSLRKEAPVYLLPGNHDVYTRKAFNQGTFYQYFPNPTLQQRRVALYHLTTDWDLVLLDCSCLNGWFEAHGQVFEEQMQVFHQVMQGIPFDKQVIVANHYPLFSTKREFHDLLNREALQEGLKQYDTIKMYLHGHDHHAEIAFLRKIPVINSGSLSLLSNAKGCVIDLYPKGFEVYTLVLENLNDADSPLKGHLDPVLSLN